MRLDEVDNVADDEQFSDGLAAGESLADVEFDACTFTGGSFVRAHLVRVTFTECTFERCQAPVLQARLA